MGDEKVIPASETVTPREIKAVREAFSRHGHGFQYAVVKECVRLKVARRTRWWVDTTEFPVEVQGTTLHIDVILRAARALMPLECKRANPSLATWCFGRTQFTSSDGFERRYVQFESVVRPDAAAAFKVWRFEPEPSEEQYNVGLEVKGIQGGDAQASGRGALDDAVTQALRGASGIINAMIGRPSVFGPVNTLKIIPAVVTTARILTCDTDLADAEFATGQLPESVTVKERPWVWLRVNASDRLKHRAEVGVQDRVVRPGTFKALADEEFARSVGIVTASGLADFLNAASFHAGDVC